MILFSLIASCARKIAVTVLEIFYEAFTQWLKYLPQELEDKIQGVLIGCKTYVDTKKSELGLAEEVSKNYSKVGDKWQVTTASREVSASEIPEEIMVRAVNDTMVDVTDELEMSLK